MVDGEITVSGPIKRPTRLLSVTDDLYERELSESTMAVAIKVWACHTSRTAHARRHMLQPS